MKIKENTLKHITKNNTEDLFLRIELLLNADLENPEIEAGARQTLALFRRHGFSLENSDLADPDCLACLYLTLLSAAELGSALQLRRSQSIH